MRPGAATLVVDGNNVMGATPDGWWRDRPAAARRLLARLQEHHRSTGAHVILVLDVPSSDLPEGEHEGVVVRYAQRRGRDAADDRIVALVDEGDEGGAAGPRARVEVVTSDRGLATRLAARDVPVVGAGSFLRRLAGTGEATG